MPREVQVELKERMKGEKGKEKKAHRGSLGIKFLIILFFLRNNLSNHGWLFVEH